MAKQSKRGGLRNPPGGRPAGPKRERCGDITLPIWLRKWLKENKAGRPMGQLIEEALIGHYGIKPPG